MAISSQRSKFLDRETDVGLADFLGMTDNAVYSAAMDSADSAVSSVKEGDDLLGKLADSISSLAEKVMNGTAAVVRKIKDALNSAIDKLLNMKLPGFVTKILDSLKSLDLGGVKSFFTDLLKVGSVFLCNNLDFLKSFMLGYSLTENILSGLLIGLLLSWLDRYCKGFSKDEVLSANNKGKLGMLFGNDGVIMTTQTALGKFSNAYADLARYSNPYTPNVPYSTSQFVTALLNGEGKSAINNLRNAEISSYDRRNYISYIDDQLVNYTPGTYEYNTLLTGRGDLLNAPLIAEARIEQATAIPNLNDALGSMVLNLKGVDLSTIPVQTLTDTEKGLLVKLEELKDKGLSDPNLITRDKEEGSFADYDFSSILPPPTADELEYLDKLPGLEESYRYNGLHPTTEVFTESTMPHSTTRPETKVPDTIKSDNGISAPGVSNKPNNALPAPGVGETYVPSDVIHSGSGNSKDPSNTSSGYNNTVGSGNKPKEAGTVSITTTDTPDPSSGNSSPYSNKEPVVPGSCYA